MNKHRANRPGTQEDITEFVRVVKNGLGYGFDACSLKMESIELHDMGHKIITLSPGLHPWMLSVVVVNPMTGQKKQSRTQFQGSIGDTTVEDVRAMVMDIVEKTKKEFFG